MPDNLLPQDGEVIYLPNFFTFEESGRYLSSLLEDICWRHEEIVIYGRKVMQPRLTAWYGDAGLPIRYSGIAMQPEPWTASLLDIKSRVEAQAGTVFTSALLNQYRTGVDSVGWHRDNEKELGPNPVIASVSFGESRTFQLRHYFHKSLKTAVELTHGSLLLMGGATQHYWEHTIPKRRRASGPRVNITFRSLIA